MSNLLKNVNKLDTKCFTNDNYIGNWWNLFDINFWDTINKKLVKDCVINFAIGYNDEDKIGNIPNYDSYAIMFKKNDLIFWTQIKAKLIGKVKYLKDDCGNISEIKFKDKYNDKTIGKKYGKLTVIERDYDYISPNSGYSHIRLKCLCDCGNNKTVFKNSLVRGLVKSCGCLSHEISVKNIRSHRNKITKEYPDNLIGKCFGELTVVNKLTPLVWKCVCNCGKTIKTTGIKLVSGSIMDCGCKQCIANIFYSKIYKTWYINIKDKNVSYKISQIDTYANAEKIIYEINNNKDNFIDWYLTSDIIKKHQILDKRIRYKKLRLRRLKATRKEYHTQWRIKNKDKIIEYRKKRQHKHHNISKTEWVKCKGYFDNKCAYCGLLINNHYYMRNGQSKNVDFHKDHFNNNGPNDLSNCIPACRICNTSKSTKPFEDWYNEFNINFTSERNEKIHKWLNEDYKMFIEKIKE